MPLIPYKNFRRAIDGISITAGLCILSIEATNGDHSDALVVGSVAALLITVTYLLSEKFQQDFNRTHTMPENRNQRYSHVSGPKAKKPPPLDVTKYHRYTPPTSDGECKPMLIATTKEGLIEKMNAPAPEPVFDQKQTNTMVPESANVIARQGGYRVDGEPET